MSKIKYNYKLPSTAQDPRLHYIEIDFDEDELDKMSILKSSLLSKHFLLQNYKNLTVDIKFDKKREENYLVINSTDIYVEYRFVDNEHEVHGFFVAKPPKNILYKNHLEDELKANSPALGMYMLDIYDITEKNKKVLIQDFLQLKHHSICILIKKNSKNVLRQQFQPIKSLELNVNDICKFYVLKSLFEQLLLALKRTNKDDLLEKFIKNPNFIEILNYPKFCYDQQLALPQEFDLVVFFSYPLNNSKNDQYYLNYNYMCGKILEGIMDLEKESAIKVNYTFKVATYKNLISNRGKVVLFICHEEYVQENTEDSNKQCILYLEDENGELDIFTQEKLNELYENQLFSNTSLIINFSYELINSEENNSFFFITEKTPKDCCFMVFQSPRAKMNDYPIIRFMKYFIKTLFSSKSPKEACRVAKNTINNSNSKGISINLSPSNKDDSSNLFWHDYYLFDDENANRELRFKIKGKNKSYKNPIFDCSEKNFNPSKTNKIENNNDSFMRQIIYTTNILGRNSDLQKLINLILRDNVHIIKLNAKKGTGATTFIKYMKNYLLQRKKFTYIFELSSKNSKDRFELLEQFEICKKTAGISNKILNLKKILMIFDIRYEEKKLKKFDESKPHKKDTNEENISLLDQIINEAKQIANIKFLIIYNQDFLKMSHSSQNFHLAENYDLCFLPSDLLYEIFMYEIQKPYTKIPSYFFNDFTENSEIKGQLIEKFGFDDNRDDHKDTRRLTKLVTCFLFSFLDPIIKNFKPGEVDTIQLSEKINEFIENDNTLKKDFIELVESTSPAIYMFIVFITLLPNGISSKLLQTCSLVYKFNTKIGKVAELCSAGIKKLQKGSITQLFHQSFIIEPSGITYYVYRSRYNLKELKKAFQKRSALAEKNNAIPSFLILINVIGLASKKIRSHIQRKIHDIFSDSFYVEYSCFDRTEFWKQKYFPDVDSLEIYKQDSKLKFINEQENDVDDSINYFINIIKNTLLIDGLKACLELLNTSNNKKQLTNIIYELYTYLPLIFSVLKIDSYKNMSSSHKIDEKKTKFWKLTKKVLKILNGNAIFEDLVEKILLITKSFSYSDQWLIAKSIDFNYQSFWGQYYKKFLEIEQNLPLTTMLRYFEQKSNFKKKKSNKSDNKNYDNLSPIKKENRTGKNAKPPKNELQQGLWGSSSLNKDRSMNINQQRVTKYDFQEKIEEQIVKLEDLLAEIKENMSSHEQENYLTETNNYCNMNELQTEIKKGIQKMNKNYWKDHNQKELESWKVKIKIRIFLLNFILGTPNNLADLQKIEKKYDRSMSSKYNNIFTLLKHAAEIYELEKKTLTEKQQLDDCYYQLEQCFFELCEKIETIIADIEKMKSKGYFADVELKNFIEVYLKKFRSESLNNIRSNILAILSDEKNIASTVFANNLKEGFVKGVYKKINELEKIFLTKKGNFKFIIRNDPFSNQNFDVYEKYITGEFGCRILIIILLSKVNFVKNPEKISTYKNVECSLLFIADKENLEYIKNQLNSSIILSANLAHVNAQSKEDALQVFKDSCFELSFSLLIYQTQKKKAIETMIINAKKKGLNFE